jgi:hypothetical protein
MQSAETDEIHLADSFCNALPSPRWGRAMVIVLGLTWLGVASAYSYFAVFAGGAVLPTVRPLMAADNGPKENLPNYGDARTSSSIATSAKNAGSNEKFDSRWPADDQQPPKTALISSDPSPALTALSVSERKKVHTIIIRSNGSEQTNTSAAAVAQSATTPRAPRHRDDGLFAR